MGGLVVGCAIFGQNRDMKITAYTAEDLRLRSSSFSSIDRVPPDTLWVDVQDPTYEEGKAIAKSLGMHLEVDEQIWDFEVYGHIEREGDQITILLSAKPSDTSISDDLDATLVALIKPNRLVTFHKGPVAAIDKLAPELGDFAVDEHAPVRLLIRIMSNAQRVVSTTLEAAEGFVRRSAYKLFTSKRNKRAEIDLESLLSELGPWRARLVEMSYRNNFILRVISLLKACPSLNLPADLTEDLELVEADGVSYRAFGQSVGDQLAQVVDATIGYIGIRQNESARWFSIVATVLMPPTLLAAVWGMNFEYMPELDEKAGYAVALALIFLSGTVPLWFARRLGRLRR